MRFVQQSHLDAYMDNNGRSESGDLQQHSDAGSTDPVAGKTVAEILGEIVWLMTQDPAGREMKVSEIESLVMPAILAKLFHIKYAQVPDMRRPGATTLQPVEASIFGSVLPETGTTTLLAQFSIAPLRAHLSRDMGR